MTKVKDPSQYGVIEFDKDNYITAFKEKPKPGETNSKWINAGIYIFEPEVFHEIPENKVVSIEKNYLSPSIKNELQDGSLSIF